MNIDVAFVAVGYMYAGYLLKYFSLKFNITTLIVMLMIWYSAYSCSTLSMSKRFYGIYYLNFLGAIAGSIILFYIAIYLSKINAIQKSLSFFGKHTIVILCIHDLDWRLPFPLWQPYLRPYLNTPLYFPLTVICRFSFDIVLAILFVLISKLIFDYYNRIRKFKLS